MNFKGWIRGMPRGSLSLKLLSTILSLFLKVELSGTMNIADLKSECSHHVSPVFCLSDGHSSKVNIFRNKEGFFEFELGSSLGSLNDSQLSNIWIAVAISKDISIGNDKVVYCLNNQVTSGSIKASESPVNEEWDTFISNKMSGISEEVLRCSFNIGGVDLVLQTPATNDSLTFNLNRDVYIHLLRGTNDKETPPITTVHTLHRTAGPVKLREFRGEGLILTNPNDLVALSEPDLSVYPVRNGGSILDFKSQLYQLAITVMLLRWKDIVFS